MWQGKNQNGFTIIELILFLALTGLFLLIAFTGIRGRTADVQFTNSIRLLESFIEQEVAGIVSGVNPLHDSAESLANSDGDLVIMGRFIHTPENSQVITSYPIIGNRITPAQRSNIIGSAGVTEIQKYERIYTYAEPRVLLAGARENNLEWGAELLFAANSSGGGLRETMGFAIIIDPFYGGESTVHYAFLPDSLPDMSAVINAGKDIFHQDVSRGYRYNRFSTHLCIKTVDGRYGEVKAGESSDQDNIDTAFDEDVDDRLKDLGCKP